MIPDWVDKYIGLPFDEYDCYDIVRLVYKNQFGIELPSFKKEYQNPVKDAEAIKAIYDRELGTRFVSTQKPWPNGIIALRIWGQPWHCGIILDDTNMLHTRKKTDCVWESFKTLEWNNRIIGYYTYAG